MGKGGETGGHRLLHVVVARASQVMQNDRKIMYAIVTAGHHSRFYQLVRPTNPHWSSILTDGGKLLGFREEGKVAIDKLLLELAVKRIAQI